MFANQLLLATDNFEYVIWDTEGIMRMGSHVGMTVAAVSELDGLRAQMPRSWEHGLVHVRVVDGNTEKFGQESRLAKTGGRARRIPSTRRRFSSRFVI